MDTHEKNIENRILFDVTPMDSQFFELKLYEQVYKRGEDEKIQGMDELMEILEKGKFKKEYLVNLVFATDHPNEKYAGQTIQCKVLLKKFRW